MENIRKKHIEKYLIHFDNIGEYNLLQVFPTDTTFCMDTESCYQNDNQVPQKIWDEKKEKMVLNPSFDFSVHVYAWAVSNTSNDFVVYGEDLKDMLKLFELIGQSRNQFTGKKTKAKIKQIKKDMKLKCFVHNLAWDIEFLKYVLKDLQYTYQLSKVDEKSKKKINVKKKPITYNIIENENIVYSADINLGDYEQHSFKTKRKGEEIEEVIDLFTSIQFLDSYKIMAQSLDSIAKNVIKIDGMFYKMGSEYDYEKVRLKGHKLNQLEKDYLYNDVYILKEWVNQFYIPLKTNQTTASSISFEQFINTKFEGEKSPYSAFMEIYPDLFDYKKIYEIIKDSYKGGWTQANKKYVGQEVICDNAVSIDINSSYPSVIKYKPLPYGEPVMYEGFKKRKEDELSILTIHFDGFKNNNEDDLIGHFQCGAMNTKIFGCNGTEYIHTNFINGEPQGGNGKSESHKYKISIWDFELEDLLKNMSFYEMEKKYNPVLDVFYDTGKVKKGYTVESTLIFKSNTSFFGEVVDKFTNMKIEGKLTGNKPKETFAKLVLNSFYGKLASNPVRMERDLVFEKGLAKFENTEINYLAEKKYYPAFSSCVTAWARVNLRSTLYKIGYNNILYFDTDSLYTTVNSDYIKDKCGDILHKTELGKWDIEKEYIKFKAIGAKKYIYNGRSFGKDCDFKISCKCAGLPSDVREVQTFESFYLGNTFTGKKSKKRVIGGYTLLEGEYKLNLFSY